MERLDMDEFEAVYARMLFVSQRRTQAELAELLNLQQGSVSEAKKRGIVPLSWCVRIADLFNVHMDWLRFGVPPVFMNPESKGYEPREEATAVFRQPPPPPLEGWREGELPVYSTVRTEDGTFPEIGRQVFPLEFVREGVKVFRVQESCMAPVINVGALVAVVPGAPAEEGALVAVLAGSGLQFRRLRMHGATYELHAEKADRVPPVSVPTKSEWVGMYYGRAIWAFQPL